MPALMYQKLATLNSKDILCPSHLFCSTKGYRQDHAKTLPIGLENG